jgi:hypothetical protein
VLRASAAMRTLCRVAPDDVQSLRRLLAAGETMLFTGAGFSSGARAQDGRKIPTTEEVTQEIWQLCFPDEPQDDSSLTDLFHYASRRCPDQLEALLKRRLCVRDEHLPGFYAAWFSVPWRRAWTLNVDDVELACARRFGLPRGVISLSALTRPFDVSCLRTDALPFIHLNGSIHEGIRNVTFSTTQYGRRLARYDAWYSQFVDDLVSHPFVIVGTKLDEAPLWQHLEASRSRCEHEHMEAWHAYIVSPSLMRARRELLEDLGIRWLQCSAEEFAAQVLTDARPDSVWNASPA